MTNEIEAHKDCCEAMDELYRRLSKALGDLADAADAHLSRTMADRDDRLSYAIRAARHQLYLHEP